MTWMAWVTYTALSFFCLLSIFNADNHNLNDISSLKDLAGLCVDNVRTQSWWTYSVCFKKSILQIHVDPRTKAMGERIHLGEFQENESSDIRQVYRSRDAICEIKHANGSTTRTHRTSLVSLQCCDVVVHHMRQSRQTLQSKYKDSGSLSNLYWMPEQVASEAVAELRSGRSPGEGYSKAPSTATSEAYIQGVEEKPACTYDISICSEFICGAYHAAHGDHLKSVRIETQSIHAHEHKEEAAAVPSLSVPSISTIPADSPSQHSATETPLPAMPSPSAEVSPEEQLELREKARDMFYHAYDSYMQNAYPEAELCPLSCTGGKFDLVKIPMVTLIDTLDTLVILGNHSEFRRTVEVVAMQMPDFRLDVNVSVFETTIRVLGGLLSAHLMAIDPHLRIYNTSTSNTDGAIEAYDGQLLELAVDLGERLMPAFDTKTAIPYGTVNLLYGVPQGETKIASTAGAGSLLLEFQVLSHLSGQRKFGEAAYAAMKGLYQRKSSIGLLGKHINTETGQWSEALSGVGSNADSYYEYLLKAYLLFRDKELFSMFSDTYRAIKRWVLVNEQVFTEVDMFSGKLQRKRVENLDAFWPGVEAMLGFTQQGADQLNTFYSVWQDLGFLPEEIEYSQWQSGKGAINGLYPLRPELIESTYHQYRTTGDRTWLSAGKMFLESIESFTRTDCGYASVTDVSTMELADAMPSFFLSETSKYLYLLFDEENFINQRPYIFSTEAHPFDSLQVHFGDIRSFTANASSSSNATEASVTKLESAAVGESASEDAITMFATEQQPAYEAAPALAQATQKRKKKRKSKADASISILEEVRRHQQSLLQSLRTGAHGQVVPVQQLLSGLPPLVAAVPPSQEVSAVDLLPLKCRKPRWWDKSTSYDAEYLQEANSLLRKEQFRGKPRIPPRKNAANRASALLRTSLHGDDPLRLLNRPDSIQLAHYSFILLDLLNALLHNSNNSNSREGSNTLSYSNTSKLKWYEVPSTLFGGNERCHPSDKPSHKAAKKTPSSQPPTGSSNPSGAADSLKSVKVSMGQLGDFQINVYSDGFFILNEQDNTSVEISNVGRSLVLMRETVGEERSNVLMANTEAHSINSCRVQVHRVQQQGSREHSAIDSDRGDIRDALFDRPCSVANFGPTLLEQSLLFEADRVLLHPNHNALLCEDPKVARADGSDQRSAWWSLLQYLGSGASEKSKTQPDSATKVLTVVDRGDCLFEDKAANARKLGAQAVIVRNTEEAVFIMAGKKDAEETLPVASASSGTADSPLPLTVMLSQSDGTRLTEILRDDTSTRQMAVDSPPLVSVVSSVTNMLLTADALGEVQYPKMYVQPRLILVVGSGRWATLLRATKGEDWQLYLMSKEDVYLAHRALAPPHVVKTASNQLKTVPHTVFADPGRLYLHLTSRKCPTFIKSRPTGDSDVYV